MVTLNADTDGDEINLHVPQDLMARAELEELMLASTSIVCSQGSKPLIGCTQDSLLGCYQLSKDKALSAHDNMAILYELGLDDPRLGTEDCPKVFRGVEVMDQVLAHLGAEFELIEIPKSGNFVLRDSRVESGVFDKGVMGASNGSLVHHVYLAYGHHTAAQFLFKMQRAANTYLDIVGFSVGVSDCIVEGHEPIHWRALDRELKSDPTREVDEAQLLEATGALTRLAEPHDCTPENNRLLTMIKSGAKGPMMNFDQITRIVGRQVVGSSRVPNEMCHGRRTLPHFECDDVGLEARGFVDRSYLKGLRPEHFFFHAAAGRIGLIDTACKTADTGAQYRRLVKALERVIVEQDPVTGDRLVKNASTGAVVQFRYGEDNMDGTYLKALS
mmetsp:Transcript_23286/g.74318  ORF Transcript_23286/g.74318 Transcript_23286/m.74318 type:complete len:387 (-) Transcript_23286:31-1191(-)